MKTIFDPSTRAELAKRINSVTDQNKAQWGKMNAFQMVKHCTHCDDMVHGRIFIPRVFMGKLLGKMLLKNVLKEGKQFGKNAPTAGEVKMTNESGDIELQKKEWLKTLEEYSDFKNHGFVHPFFGPMNKEQIGIFMYKHSDHHLRQFGA